jgi:uncharacterized protein (DUF885 family)
MRWPRLDWLPRSASPRPELQLEVTHLDDRFESLVAERFAAVMQRFPVFATFLGLAEHDHRLSDGSRDAVEQDIADGRAYLARLEAIDPERLSAANRVERELAIFSTRRQLFDDEVHRVWQRRAAACDELGDGIFLLLARSSRPLPERLAAIAGRLAAAPRLMAEQRSRLADRPMRLWLQLELEAAAALPDLFEDVGHAARNELGEDHSETRRLTAEAETTERALEDYSGWLREALGRADDRFALGTEDYDELIRLRALDGLSTDEILDIGHEQLAHAQRARRAAAAQIDPAAAEEDVLERVKGDHPPDFDRALETYCRAIGEARAFVVDHDIASLPEGESLSVAQTPRYLRNVLPFAAYFAPPRFGADATGLYIITPSVDGDARALREHNYASIYNTCIHEAYPGHHLQLATANRHPSLVRPLIDAPEFVEGWAMYCEQMMRDAGFDDAPERQLMMHTDAIWRACRIILDIRLHRGEVSLGEAVNFLVDKTGFERPNATAEVNRHTYTPTYQLSYLLGKVLLLRLRADEQVRLGVDFSLRRFHDRLLREGSLPISFQRRLLRTGEADAA